MNGNASKNKTPLSTPREHRRIIADLIEAAMRMSDEKGNFDPYDPKIAKVLEKAYRQESEMTRDRVLRAYLDLLISIYYIDHTQGMGTNPSRTKMHFTGRLAKLDNMDIALIAQFISEIRSVSGLEGAFLYGSAARGELGQGSDIDILLIFENPPDKSLSTDMAKIVTKLNPEREIQCILTDLTDLGPAFLENIARECVRLYGGAPLSRLIGGKFLPLQSYVIVNYNLSGLPYSKKVKVSRMVHGYSTRKKYAGKQKEYHYAGLKDRPGAMLISEGTILLPETLAKEFSEYLSAQEVQHKKKHVEIIFKA